MSAADRRARRTRRRQRAAGAFSVDMLRGRALVMVGLGPDGKATLTVDVSGMAALERQRLYREWRKSTGDYALIAAHESIVGTEPGCAEARFFFVDGTEITWTIDDGPTPNTWKSSWRVVRAGPDAARVEADLRAEHEQQGCVPMDGRWAQGGSA